MPELSHEQLVIHHGPGATQREWLLTYDDGFEESVRTRWVTRAEAEQKRYCEPPPPPSAV